MTVSRFFAVIDGRAIRRTSSKDPRGREYMLAQDYDELISWIAGHKTCKWEPDENGIYHSGCGNAFEFCADGPRENEFSYCPYCGSRLAV